MNKVCPLFLAVIVFAACSCNTGKNNTSKISEGYIEYEITYPKIDKDDIFMIGMMPKDMKMKFKDNNTIGELKTGAGVFTTKFITNNNERNLFHYLKLVNKKYGLILDSADIYQSYAKKPDDMQLIPSDSTKIIAGYTCKRMDVVFSDSTKNFSIYYTDDIGIKDPNWCSPFHEIKGVLMEYNISQFNVEMHLRAKAVTAADIDDEEFAVPADYEKITQKEMEEKFTDF